jgi:putative transposase
VAWIVRRQVKTLWATDFFTKTVWTLCGPVACYVLFFTHIHSRRMHIADIRRRCTTSAAEKPRPH